ncbi:hypothetical protein EBZ70_07975 [bacterium]|nr:hypothetical protein [bacterium]
MLAGGDLGVGGAGVAVIDGHAEVEADSGGVGRSIEDIRQFLVRGRRRRAGAGEAGDAGAITDQHAELAARDGDRLGLGPNGRAAGRGIVELELHRPVSGG